MTKEEKIKEAWEKSNRPNIEYNHIHGWSIKHVEVATFSNDYFDSRNEYSKDSKLYAVIRPKSLQGIEDNNGWRIVTEDWLKSIKIDVSVTKYYVDSPDEDYFDIAIQLNDEEKSIIGLPDYLFILDELKKSNIKAIRYQPIIKPKPPIY